MNNGNQRMNRQARTKGAGPTDDSRQFLSLTVDDETVTVPEGATLLDAARRAGADVPVLCYHETLEPIGACRVCVVEVEGQRVLQPACQRRAEPDMVVRTDSERVKTSRRMVVELLQTSADTSRAPDVERYARQFGTDPDRWRLAPAPEAASEAASRAASEAASRAASEAASRAASEAASEAGEMTGATTDGPAADLPNGRARRAPVIDNELYVRDLDRCIMCYRCVEACGEQVQNSFAIAPAGRGSDIFIDAGFLQPLPDSACVFCGNCVAVCPTGALIFATEFELREQGAWDEAAQTVTQTTCPYCGVGCQVELHVQNNRIVKATAPVDDPITRGYLCVKGRFGWEYVHAGADEGTGEETGRDERAGEAASKDAASGASRIEDADDGRADAAG